ncbi:MAG: hypothetical protein ACREDS_03995 [Limisphaerales bacterium]
MPRAALKLAWTFRRFHAGLGIRDGGALCMKTYDHLRDEHSQREALKVTF